MCVVNNYNILRTFVANVQSVLSKSVYLIKNVQTYFVQLRTWSKVSMRIQVTH